MTNSNPDIQLEPNKPSEDPLESQVSTVDYAPVGPTLAMESATCDGERRWSRGEVLGCFILTVIMIQVCLGPKLRLSQWEADAKSNAGIAEGVAWLNGRYDITPANADELDLRDPEQRQHDTAYFEDRVYNVFPPLVSMLTVAFSPLHNYLIDKADFWLPQPYVYTFFWPLVIATFVVFYRQLRHPVYAAVLTLGFIGGTAVLPNLYFCRSGYLGQMDHVISQVGLLILAADVLGKQRIWPALLGLMIATYSRQLTSLYGLVLLFVAARRYGAKGFMLTGIGLAFIAAPLLFLNYQKFGNPLDFGYANIYVGRETEFMGSRVAEHGVFSPAFIGDNLYYMHAAPPLIAEASLTQLRFSDGNNVGTSLWITTPLALWLLLGVGVWWKRPGARPLILGTLPILVGLALYHSPGYLQHGYNRFALDFLPIWLVVAAPAMFRGKRQWRTWFSLACIAWSLLYFQSITPDARVAQPDAHVASISGAEHGQV